MKPRTSNVREALRRKPAARQGRPSEAPRDVALTLETVSSSTESLEQINATRVRLSEDELGIGVSSNARS